MDYVRFWIAMYQLISCRLGLVAAALTFHIRQAFHTILNTFLNNRSCERIVYEHFTFIQPNSLIFRGNIFGANWDFLWHLKYIRPELI